jgi:hypothetical protein
MVLPLVSKIAAVRENAGEWRTKLVQPSFQTKKQAFSRPIFRQYEKEQVSANKLVLLSFSVNMRPYFYAN